jgi:uncharacterized protein (DUF1684 family)
MAGSSDKMNKSFFARTIFTTVISLASLYQVAGNAGESDARVPVSDYEQLILEWRNGRVARLTSEDGYLTQVGLEWLEEGENRLGLTHEDGLPIPGGPVDWGRILLEGNRLMYFPPAGSGIRVDGELVEQAQLTAKNQGEPTLVSHGTLSFYVIFRQSYALRIKDVNGPDRINFAGIESYDIQPDWRMNARFTRAQAGQTIEIANVLGQTGPEPVFGTIEFDRDGEHFRLIALGDEDSTSLWFLFADRTSGRETYGAGRFLYSDGMPLDGRVIVDFNKAYNPPCAFNDFSTCPLPPQENRLDLAVRAGEKKYHD